MKETLTCPKCEHKQLWHFAEMRERGEGDSLHPLRVAFWKADDKAGHFEAFICAQCGYTEWYANGIDNLKENPALGLSLIGHEQGGKR